MSDETRGDEEVRRVAVAIADIEKIPDAGDRAVAAGKVLAQLPEHSRRVKEIRQQAVLTLRDQGLSWGEIGALLGLHRQRAKDIAEGMTGGARARKPKPVDKRDGD